MGDRVYIVTTFLGITMWQRLLKINTSLGYLISTELINLYSILDSLVHKWFKILKIAKNMKQKKFSLLPDLNCLSPHVANGDKVGNHFF